MSATEPTPQPAVEEPDPVLVAIERAMVKIRRRQTQRVLGQIVTKDEPHIDLNQIAAVDAVAEGPDETQEGVTVGVVAERLGIDPSRASRVVAATIQNGYLRRIASQHDGRRSCLEITDQGAAALEQTHRARHALYERLLAGWTVTDRRDLARLLTRFTASISADESGPAAPTANRT
ncbi:MarR family winged helix-turn-helix transcriptional regulator [Salinispora vitiensis]|uniref:MarR family winged helix-turn-helix transcriptional regulator n=1 Tax=Salinispora vitiensis TaxID=999544 RepID=UPI0003701262|nr:MarR family transcriptional regulator [Salinispora vitiensis]